MDYRTFNEHLRSDPALTFKPTLLLLAPFLASCLLFPANTRVANGIALVGAGASTFQWAFAITCFVASVILVATSSQGWKSPVPRAVTCAAAVGYIFAQGAAFVLFTLNVQQDVAYIAFGVLAGICIGPVVARWIALYALDFRSIIFHGALTCLLSSVLGWLIAFLAPVAALVAFLACLVMGTLPTIVLDTQIRMTEAHAAEQLSNQEPSVFSRVGSLLSFIGVPIAGMVMLIIVSGAQAFTYQDQHVQSEFIGILIGSVVVLALSLMRMKTSFALVVETIAVPVCVAVSMAFGAFPVESPVFAIGAPLVFMPLTIMTLIALASLVVISIAGEFPLPFVFGLGLACAMGALLVSMGIEQLHLAPQMVGSMLWLLVCLYYGIVFIHTGYLLWKQSARPTTDALTDAPRQEPEVDPEEIRAMHARLIDEAAQRFNLTKREQEILGHLSLGYNSVSISKMLFISESTTRTHIKNIYRKMGVSSREELQLLVNGIEQEG